MKSDQQNQRSAGQDDLSSAKVEGNHLNHISEFESSGSSPGSSRQDELSAERVSSEMAGSPLARGKNAQGKGALYEETATNNAVVTFPSANDEASTAKVRNYDNYDPETYRPEINKALAHARRILKGRAVFIEGIPTKSEGDMAFEELMQDVNLEIWEAQRHYGDRMNARLAYQIAKNQAKAFLRRRIKSQTIVDTDEVGNPLLDEFGLARGLDGSELKRQSKDPIATAEDRRKAKKLIHRYSRKYPRFVSLDDKPQSDEEEEVTTFAEREIFRIRGWARPDLSQILRDLGGLPALRRLVGAWRGDKRRVGEAMLKPDFTVRSVPELDKSKVWRLSQGVRKDLRAFLTGSKY